jgi:hypothetical protein
VPWAKNKGMEGNRGLHICIQIAGLIRKCEDGKLKLKILTDSAFARNGMYPLSTNTPANLRSVVKQVRIASAAPWLRPPTTIRSGGMPDSISALIRSLICPTALKSPVSSSGRFGISKE